MSVIFTHLILHFEAPDEHLTRVGELSPRCSCLAGNRLHTARIELLLRPSVFDDIERKLHQNVVTAIDIDKLGQFLQVEGRD